MSIGDIIKNFGLMQDQVTAVQKQLADTIVPVVDRVNLNEVTQKDEFKQAMDNLAGLESRLQKSVNPIIQGWDNLKDNVETYRIELGQNRAQHIEFEKQFSTLGTTIDSLRRHVDTCQATNQGQIGTLLATQGQRPFGGGGGGSAGGGDQRPLVTNRLFDNLSRLSGNEDHGVMDDWYNEVERNFELLIPHSAQILDWAARNPEPITFTTMTEQQNATMVLRVSRELFALLMNKTEDKAKSHVKMLTPQDGLEAWRMVKVSLNRRDGQRLQAEFDALTTQLKPVTMSELKNLTTLLAKWEKELRDFENLDKEYKVGTFQRRQIIYKILPDEVKRMVTYQQGMGSLKEYDDFLSFVKTIASSSMYSSWKAPAALTAGTNLLAPVEPGAAPRSNLSLPGDPATAQYTHDECVAWIGTPEGEQYVNENNVTDPIMVQAIFAVAKGKGKGKNKLSGNPKGGAGGKTEFHGRCHK